MAFNCLVLHSSSDWAVRFQTCAHNIYFSFCFVLREDAYLSLISYRLNFCAVISKSIQEIPIVRASGLAVCCWVQQAFSFTCHIFWALKLMGCFETECFHSCMEIGENTAPVSIWKRIFGHWVCLCILLEHL